MGKFPEIMKLVPSTLFTKRKTQYHNAANYILTHKKVTHKFRKFLQNLYKKTHIKKTKITNYFKMSQEYYIPKPVGSDSEKNIQS